MVNILMTFLLLSAFVPAIGAVQVPVIGMSLQSLAAYAVVWLVFAAPINRLLKAIISPTGERVEFSTDNGFGRLSALIVALMRRFGATVEDILPKQEVPTSEGKKVTIQVAPKPKA
jgi:hypothetical protein